MLALLIGLLVAGGPVLRGSWDLWSQSALFIAAAGGLGAWLAWRVFIGYVPAPSGRQLAWAAALSVLAGLSAFLSPVSAYAVPQWRALLLGVWIIPAMAAVSKDERLAIDQAARAAAWVLVLLAFYQRFHDGLDRPPSALLNQNIFAGAILMLLPLSVQLRDWLLSAALLLCLFWSRSLGAWLGLSAALLLTRRRPDGAGSWAGLTIGAVCLLGLTGRLFSGTVDTRVGWWSAAAAMAGQRPWLGFGPGSFAYVVPAFEDPARPLGTLFAHNHFLETAAELGLPYLLLWAGGVAVMLRRGSPHKRIGALAVLVQSLWDYTLSVPGLFWLFCYLAASTGSETSRGLNVTGRRKAGYALLCLAVAAGLSAWCWRRWEADWLKADAALAYTERAPSAEVARLIERSAALAEDPELERLAAELELANLGADPEAGLRRAARRLESSARLNPYRASTWTALERIYQHLGEKELSGGARRRGARFCPVLRGPAA